MPIIVSASFMRLQFCCFLLAIFGWLHFLIFRAIFGRLHFYYFGLFWPFSGGCIFIIFGPRFGHFLVAAFLLLQAILAIFGWLHFYYFGPFAMFERLHFYYFGPLWPFSGGCIFISYGRFGSFWVAAFLLFSADLGIFGWLHFY